MFYNVYKIVKNNNKKLNTNINIFYKNKERNIIINY